MKVSYVFLLFIGLSLTHAGLVINGTVYIQGCKTTFVKGILDDNGAAYGTFEEGLLTTGWGVLNIKAGYGKGATTEVDMMFAAGYLEAALTQGHIYNQFINLKSWLFGNKTEEVISKLKNFIDQQEIWMKSQAEIHKDDESWQAFGLIIAQYEGLITGYQALAPPSQLMNGAGDLNDLVKAVDKKGRPDFDKMTHKEVKRYTRENDRCSVLIKILAGLENIFFSHSTWWVYQSTDRIFKYYDFNLEHAASKKMSFSSYPGIIISMDDFYMMDSGLIMLQTTNNIYNLSLYDLVHPKSLPAWIRVRAANMMSHISSDWGEWLSKYNSGTYTSQFMILDMKNIRLNESIDDGALSVVEQIPGLVKFADQTDKLRLGYWPSYNIPFYEEIYKQSGYPEMVKTKGLDYSYQMAPRAKIFRRDSDKVVDMETMKRIMRYNDYKRDPYSRNDPCNTICCREDLDPKTPAPTGCYDTKVADYAMAAKRMAWVINGPSRGDNLQPFAWSQFHNISHIGLPPVYNFDFILMKPHL